MYIFAANKRKMFEKGNEFVVDGRRGGGASPLNDN
jgi:hypothetical protein